MSPLGFLYFMEFRRFSRFSVNLSALEKSSVLWMVFLLAVGIG